MQHTARVLGFFFYVHECMHLPPPISPPPLFSQLSCHVTEVEMVCMPPIPHPPARVRNNLPAGLGFQLAPAISLADVAQEDWDGW